MATKDHYISVAKQIAEYLNAFKLAFKTYNTKDLDAMIKAVAGEGARVSASTSEELEKAMQERGLICFPGLAQATDGYVRIYRAGTVVANLLQAFRYPGPSGDGDLAALLRALHRPRAAAASDEGEDSAQ